MNEQRNTVSAIARPKASKRADGTTMITGYASVFYRADDPGTEYDLGYGICERIAPTAFNRALAEKQDVVCRFDHEDTLGRSTSGTLRLSVDKIGLMYECDIPDTQAGRDTALLIERGDVQGSSFSFRAKAVRWMDGEDCEIREVQDCDLFDVGPVVFPAYQSTTTGVRAASDEALEAVKTERDEWRSKLASESIDEAADVELRLKLLALDE